MPKISKKILLIFALIIVTVAVFLGVLLSRQPSTGPTVMHTVSSWGRLAYLPEQAKDLQISNEGGLFTRSFRVRFMLPTIELQKWIDASEGLKDASKETLLDGTEKFVIKPGAGAQYAEVIINRVTGEVKIYVSWS